jgi:hypothetical protein
VKDTKAVVKDSKGGDARTGVVSPFL